MLSFMHDHPLAASLPASIALRYTPKSRCRLSGCILDLLCPPPEYPQCVDKTDVRKANECDFMITGSGANDERASANLGRMGDAGGACVILVRIDNMDGDRLGGTISIARGVLAFAGSDHDARLCRG